MLWTVALHIRDSSVPILDLSRIRQKGIALICHPANKVRAFLSRYKGSSFEYTPIFEYSKQYRTLILGQRLQSLRHRNIEAPRYENLKYAVKGSSSHICERDRERFQKESGSFAVTLSYPRRRIKDYLPHLTLHWNLLALISEIYFQWQRDKRNIHPKEHPPQGTSLLF